MVSLDNLNFPLLCEMSNVSMGGAITRLFIGLGVKQCLISLETRQLSKKTSKQMIQTFTLNAQTVFAVTLIELTKITILPSAQVNTTELTWHCHHSRSFTLNIRFSFIYWDVLYVHQDYQTNTVICSGNKVQDNGSHWTISWWYYIKNSTIISKVFLLLFVLELSSLSCNSLETWFNTCNRASRSTSFTLQEEQSCLFL